MLWAQNSENLKHVVVNNKSQGNSGLFNYHFTKNLLRYVMTTCFPCATFGLTG